MMMIRTWRSIMMKSRMMMVVMLRMLIDWNCSKFKIMMKIMMVMMSKGGIEAKKNYTYGGQSQINEEQVFIWEIFRYGIGEHVHHHGQGCEWYQAEQPCEMNGKPAWRIIPWAMVVSYQNRSIDHIKYSANDRKDVGA